MPIHLYNSAAQAVEAFSPQVPGEINVYVCGPTVYDSPHIGNLRPAIVFDVLHRLLRRTYPDHIVRFVQNFTDIDDKIIERANQRGQSIEAITDQAILDYNSMTHRLHVVRPYDQPRATMHVLSIGDDIDDLIRFGAAYVAEGHVLFDVGTSKHRTELVPDNTDLEAGARVEVASYKRDPRDFVLWKPSKDGEPSYPGPISFNLPGRPGWHIECSSMIESIFLAKHHKREGYILDIHAGGMDLKFPHHTCEIMQSETLAAYEGHDRSLARFWVHNGMLTVGGRKMAKSAGNFVTGKEAFARAHPEALRLLLLSGHYRHPLDFTWERLAEATVTLDRLYGALEAVWDAGSIEGAEPNGVVEALNNDLNTPEALAELHKLADRARADGEDRVQVKSMLLAAGDLLGILRLTPDEWFRALGDDELQVVKQWIVDRERFRKEKRWDMSDEIRDNLREMFDVVLEDNPDGTRWRRQGGTS